MDKVLIVGFGRFGKVLAKILQDDFQVFINDEKDISDEITDFNANQVEISEGIEIADTIFYAVPISKFDEIFTSHLRFFENAKPKTVLDVLSVKVYAKRVLEESLPKQHEAILTHPIFGPDSVRVNGLPGLRIMIDQFKSSSDTYRFWVNYFAGKELKVIEMSAEEHDKHVANSQGVVFFLGRLLEDFGFQKTPVDTFWVEQLHEIVYTAVCNDTWELFTDLQTKNPFTNDMRVRIGESYNKIYSKLLPDRINKEKLIIGIQGGVGSFNEEAVRYYTKRQGIENYELRYLHTTENVLDALYRGEIDRGQFAFNNSTGGAVKETVEAMAKYKFKIIEEFGIKISHSLMIRPDTDFSEIDTIMTHPQVLKQCKENLAQKYQNLKKTSGEGELIDHAKVADLLSKKELPKNIAVMGSKVLSEVFGLKIIEENLQDLKDNFTSFLFVSRI